MERKTCWENIDDAKMVTNKENGLFGFFLPAAPRDNFDDTWKDNFIILKRVLETIFFSPELGKKNKINWREN